MLGLMCPYLGGDTCKCLKAGSAYAWSCTVPACGTGVFRAGSGGYVYAPPATGGLCFFGYAYVALDSLGTTASTPNDATVRTAANPPSYQSCGTSCALSVTGTIAATSGAFAQIGFSIDQPLSNTAAHGSPLPLGNALMINWSASASTPKPLSVVLVGSDGLYYCGQLTVGPPDTIKYTSFNTKCYDTPADGVAYDPTKIGLSAIALQVSPGATSAGYDFTLTDLQDVTVP